MLMQFRDYSSWMNRAEYERRVVKERENYTIDFGTDFSNYELVHLYLENNRKIENVVIYNNRYLIHQTTVAAPGQVARDALIQYNLVLNPPIQEVFKFANADISRIEKVPDTRLIFLGLFKRPIKLTTFVTLESRWTVLPKDEKE